ncbi:hypothetical protein [Bacillus sp. RAR_GA_16]|uniref:hypothetical protein n=1 Tax=Bacillus sp. RAR_GA_16 TaxID=2876774 RepID=UPI001CC9F035|nr:hypothetical protein [Bacillus sp. RAR_GA_16]MCA0172908.1 hypothetical protein [Bacillus sp. RAR_GA_16]
MDLKLAAEIHRVGLEVGYFEVKDVIQWTDQLIEELDHPPIELIDVSLTVNQHSADVCSKLKLVKGHVDATFIVKVILGLINEYLKESRDFSNVGYMLTMLNEIPLEDSELASELWWVLEWEILAIEELAGNLEDARKGIEKFLKQFSGYEKYYTPEKTVVS